MFSTEGGQGRIQIECKRREPDNEKERKDERFILASLLASLHVSLLDFQPYPSDILSFDIVSLLLGIIYAPLFESPQSNHFRRSFKDVLYRTPGAI